MFILKKAQRTHKINKKKSSSEYIGTVNGRNSEAIKTKLFPKHKIIKAELMYFI